MTNVFLFHWNVFLNLLITSGTFSVLIFSSILSLNHCFLKTARLRNFME